MQCCCVYIKKYDSKSFVMAIRILLCNFKKYSQHFGSHSPGHLPSLLSAAQTHTPSSHSYSGVCVPLSLSLSSSPCPRPKAVPVNWANQGPTNVKINLLPTNPDHSLTPPAPSPSPPTHPQVTPSNPMPTSQGRRTFTSQTHAHTLINDCWRCGRTMGHT